MCGISAIVGKGQVNTVELQSMLSPIAHRGDKKYFNENNIFSGCALGMNRMAIVDRKNAKQPMASMDGRYYIVFNGEIYNYKEIRKELVEKGYEFKTDSDTEVLVNGYAEWREKVLEKVNGMFAFFIYDTQTESFFAARDPIGVKPLYFAQNSKERYYFASEIKSLVNLSGVKEIKLFPAGHYMMNGKLKRYFSLPNKTKANLNEDIIIKEIRSLFDNAVKIRVQTDLPIAVYLSGGIDSTAVLATARKYHPDVTAIIIGNLESSDRKVAVKYCEENKIKYIVKSPPNEEELFKNIKEIVRITESFEPNMIRQSALSYHIAKTAKEAGFKVILCGKGADEIFAGYPEFTKLKNCQQIENKINKFVSDLHRTQLQRVDRTSMYFTTEVREPFLDKNFLKYVLEIPANLKIKNVGGKTITKYILRKAMEDRLPEYIYNREKVVLSEGAGYKGNQKVGGLFYEIIDKLLSDKEVNTYKEKYSEWKLENKEDVYYFKHFLSFGYPKALFNQKRTIVNKINTETEYSKIAHNILEVFNTWQYKREQPNTTQKILESILKNIQKKRPIPFVMYWGKGKKKTANTKEKEALAFLHKMLGGIKNIYPPGFTVKIIFTDTHATLNGYNENEIKQYYDSVSYLKTKYNFNFLYLSELVEYKEEVLLEKVEDIKINPKLMNSLINSSKKHFKKEKDFVLGAKLYYLQNQIEKKIIDKTFSNSIFLTYNSNELDGILPEKIPLFYMYSLKKGTSIKPWFC